MELAALAAAHPPDGSALPLAEAWSLPLFDAAQAPTTFGAAVAAAGARLPPGGRPPRLIVVLGRNLL